MGNVSKLFSTIGLIQSKAYITKLFPLSNPLVGGVLQIFIKLYPNHGLAKAEVESHNHWLQSHLLHTFSWPTLEKKSNIRKRRLN